MYYSLCTQILKKISLIAPEIKREPKNERGGRGRGRKETLADKPLDFETAFASARSTYLALLVEQCVDQRFVSY